MLCNTYNTYIVQCTIVVYLLSVVGFEQSQNMYSRHVYSLPPPPQKKVLLCVDLYLVFCLKVFLTQPTNVHI